MENIYKDKKILILGLGLNQGGVGTARFFASLGAKVKVTDLKSKEILKDSLSQLKDFPDIEYTLGEHKNEDIIWADIIIRNPAIRDNNPYLQCAQEIGKQVETDLSIFLQIANQKKIIAVTGTKGKSTTASLIYEVMKLSGKEVIFAGNIGKSILEVIPFLKNDPWIVVEISSFQLHCLKYKNFSPHIALITNIYPDHLNWHSSMEEYIEAKKIVAKGQTADDFLFISCNKILNRDDFLKGIKSQISFFCEEDFSEDNRNIDFPLKGSANLENYAAAESVCETIGIDKNIILQAFQNFRGQPFRMEEIGEYRRIKIINDSTSTNPIATIHALASLGNPNVILIAGGMNKGMEYHKLAAEIETYNPAKALFLIEGDATDELKKYLRKPFIVKGKGQYNNLDELLNDIKKIAEPGDIILFSPGATSFNLFQNEFDRGRKFNTAVEKVFGAGNS